MCPRKRDLFTNAVKARGSEGAHRRTESERFLPASQARKPEADGMPGSFCSACSTTVTVALSVASDDRLFHLAR